MVRLEFFPTVSHPVFMETQPTLGAGTWGFSRRFPWVLIALIVTCVSIEMALQGADLGMWGSTRWRSLAYQNGGFWRGLLDNWRPNYAAQPVTMFATYSFLHSGLAHLTVNMITLFSLGRIVIERTGQARFAAIYMLSILGGAVGFALLSDAVQPMVGASGALFGLAGVLVGWEYTARRLEREGLWPVARVIGFLILLNVIMYWAMDGLLAWETHLGGFVTGWIAGWWIREREN
ncbi:rhomboid family intramembrane serine protease [Aestuariivita boseongensis]|uniref:rhomboid family intramembrane serine protease n=1 Tax=Aestuariivita boseongensis TaxID=1470562 RepID=UPI001FE06D29|nr:rhomboid family intramembrane serine protease [Aestuariivita boseongensis]